MGLKKLKKGLNVPITGEPKQVISPGNPSAQVALIGYDFIGLKPTLAVNIGDRVKIGQLLFTDKKTPGVKHTSPAGGTVLEINRGDKRVFESIVLQVDEKEEALTFPSYSPEQLPSLTPEVVRQQLLDSGLWTALRARPFGKVADPATTPHSLFITAMDTNPLAPAIETILADPTLQEAFKAGLQIATHLTQGRIFLCKAPGTAIPTIPEPRLSIEEFAGPHPAGNVGTHIHFLDPVNRHLTVWHLDAQDVIAWGQFFTSGQIPVERIISLAGPAIQQPRLIKTRIGASIANLCQHELLDHPHGVRVISGSVLSGRTASGPLAYLGRYHQQITALPESKNRVFLGWLAPGLNLFSLKRILLSSLFPKKKFAFTTDQNGGKRAVFPVGSYDTIMPMDTEITYLLRALMVEDIEEAENLGCLELVEEDLALCSFVSPAKNDYAQALRRNLTIIDKEG